METSEVPLPEVPPLLDDHRQHVAHRQHGDRRRRRRETVRAGLVDGAQLEHDVRERAERGTARLRDRDQVDSEGLEERHESQ